MTSDTFAEFEQMLAEMRARGAVVGPIMMMAAGPTRKALNRRYRKREKADTVVVSVPVSVDIQKWLIERHDPAGGKADRVWLRRAILTLITEAFAAALPVTREMEQAAVERDNDNATEAQPKARKSVPDDE
ncbi:hypothetical protein CK228_34115 [Mesorhizobium sp. WSM4312]|uniref:hypothetical protein n=1 Tax=Mesorhizobium sp. WSM4312 TaxID=2029411 RepID=UPI000BB0BDB6|nr:hypothetical protein [Mesorhizobium sp. WSM4312]PBB64243.1 hypothetical protein CK228_34115 [Mesorhizobium sp. WSM4312]